MRLYSQTDLRGNMPSVIKFSFLRLAAQNKNAVYACLNYGEAFTLDAIEKQSICLDADISKVLQDL